MPSESEQLVVGFFHAMRAEAKRARRRGRDDVTTDRIVRYWLEREEQRAEGRKADWLAERYAWERQFG